MSQPPYLREQLLSLRRLVVDDQPLTFRQAFISLRQEGARFSWNCTVRGLTWTGAASLSGDVSLRAETLDGRTIAGHVLVLAFVSAAGDEQQPVELEGVGQLLIDGRPLSAISAS
jgi:hypothetical protein